MACENENATATYGSLRDAFSALKRADGAQTSAFGGGKACLLYTSSKQGGGRGKQGKRRG